MITRLCYIASAYLLFSIRRSFVSLLAKWALPISLAIFALPAVGQSLQHSEFRLAYNENGVTRLMHVPDKYETDYIARGRTLGDVLIRYRRAGETDWLKASAAVQGPGNFAEGQGISYEIGELVPTL